MVDQQPLRGLCRAGLPRPASDVNVDGLDLEVGENAGELWGHGLPP